MNCEICMHFSEKHVREVIFILNSCRTWFYGTLNMQKKNWKTNTTHKNFCSFRFVALKIIHIIKFQSFLMLLFTMLSALLLKCLCAQLVVKIPSILWDAISIQIWVNSHWHFYYSMASMIFQCVSVQGKTFLPILYLGIKICY